jgi:hypothetical protein
MKKTFLGLFRGEPQWADAPLPPTDPTLMDGFTAPDLQAAIDAAARHAQSNNPAVADEAANLFKQLAMVQINRAVLVQFESYPVEAQ